MSAKRFFIEGVHARGERVDLDAADAHKIVDVLRLGSGDAIEAIDSAGVLFRATLFLSGKRLEASLDDVIDARGDDDALEIDVAQGLPKGQKMDFVVEKLTELGVRRIIPFESERAVVRDAGSAKLERWRRLAQSAAQQSGRRTIPEIADPLAFDALLEQAGAYDLVLFPWEIADAQVALRATLPGLLSGARRVLAIVGPEGGFSHAEAARAQQAGAKVISLGRRVLRTETAGIVLVSILQYLSA